MVSTLLLWAACGVMPVLTAGQGNSQELRTMTLDELMKLEVTTVMRVPQAKLLSPPSVFVLTEDDIMRSGATTLAELLRLVPGVHVAQIDGNKWAVGIRGFTDRLARAMLVLIDGRAVYDPLFAGTYWEALDFPLEDIDRIEVVRGPGGALWGANAVTGVVNVIRKSAAESKGVGVSIASGTADPAVVGLRYGGTTGSGVKFRLTGQFSMRSPQTNALNLNYDDAKRTQLGFRTDWDTRRGSVTLQGDAYYSVIGQRDTLTTYSPPSAQNIVTSDPLTGANTLLRWTQKAADPHSATLQAYYDYTTRDELVFQERQHIGDVDFQQGHAGHRHDLLWGAGYRFVAGATTTEGTLLFDPADRHDQLFTAFVQDGITLVPDRLHLFAGVKVEHNDYSGVEWQPNGRLVWTMSSARALSFSATRAVRTPSRVETDFETGSLISPAGPTFLRLLPNPSFDSEVLVAYEAGLITSLGRRVLATVSVFHNEHDNVLSTVLGTPFVETDAGGSRTIFPLQFSNGLHGHSNGVEVTADARLASWWRVTGNYSYFILDLSKKPGGQDLSQEVRDESGSPRHQVQLTSTVNVSSHISVDWFLRYVSAVPTYAAPEYTTSNLRFAWQINPSVNVYVLGRNLHQKTHFEFSDGSNGQFGIERAILVGLRWTK
jgi:iron complex outermembrane receptor protein